MADRRSWAWMMAAAVVVCSTACSGAGDEVEVDGASSTSTATSSPPTTGPPSSAPSAGLEPAGAGVGGLTVADPSVSSEFAGQPVVGHGDEFVRFDLLQGTVVLWVSADGITWEQRESQPMLSGYVAAVGSDGARIVALLSDPMGEVALPAVWTSEDGGRTWSELPLPEVLPPVPEYVDASLQLGGVAVDGDRIVATALIDQRVNWQRYSVEVLRQDHGFVNNEGGVLDAWTVQFEDGFELTVNLAELGFPESGYGGSAPVTVLVHDGSGWVESTGFTLDGPEISPPEVVTGPAGFAARAGTRFVTSHDGLTWTEHSVPTAAAEFGARALGGAAGYVLVTPASLFHAADGESWTEVYKVGEADPWTTGYGFMGPWSYAGGAAGFVVGIPVYGNQGIESVSVAWSADGITWEGQPLPDGTFDIGAAVSNTVRLVLPVTEHPTYLPSLPGDDEGLRQALVSTFFHPDGQVGEEGFEIRLWMTEDDAECTADRLLDAVGGDRLREIGFGAFPFHLLGYGLSYLIELDDASAIASSMRACSPDWELFMITTATAGADEMSEPSARCTAEALDDEVSAEMMAIELARPYDDAPGVGSPDLSHLQPLWDALDECLTDQELNALDWS